MIVKIFRASLTVLVLLIFSDTFSQTYAETALLFSRTRAGGSARIQSIGGSQIALGGDYSSSGSNPAGLGMFNRSEFTLSTALTSNTISSEYETRKGEDNRTVFNIPGISLVWHLPKENGKFLGGSLAISLTRTNDFNGATLYRGDNSHNSISESFALQAAGATVDQFEDYNSPVDLAYHTYLIGPQDILPGGGPDDEYFTDAGRPAFQQEEILVKGATSQWNFAYGGNINDKFFFGGSLGISSLRYKQEKIFIEVHDKPDVINSLQLNENLDIRGNGINLTLGVIGRPVNFLQVGVSYTTPTFYNLTEIYEASMDVHWDNFDYFGDGSEMLNDESEVTDIITSDYNLRTPSKLSAGVTFLSKFGFITSEIGYTNYGNAKYSSDTPGISYSEDNDEIKTAYTSTLSYRTGLELRYKIYRLRAGFGVQTSPLKDDVFGDADNALTTFSGGTGIRLKTFYIDFALINQSGNYDYAPYGIAPTVDLKSRVTTGVITAGFTF